jgi:hypothetical protein
MTTQDSFYSLVAILEEEVRSEEAIEEFRRRWWLAGCIACPHCLLDRRTEQPLFKMRSAKPNSYFLNCPNCRHRFVVNVE